MADWTDIPDTTLEPGAPAKGRDARFLRDNPIAIAEGAPGAPRIQTPALDSGVVTNAKVANGTLGAEKFQSGTDERDWVLARTAAASLGAVGTYALMRQTSGAAVSSGGTIAGSNLTFSNASDGENGLGASTASGTWRLMGANDYTGEVSGATSLWLRIS